MLFLRLNLSVTVSHRLAISTFSTAHFMVTFTTATYFDLSVIVDSQLVFESLLMGIHVDLSESLAHQLDCLGLMF